MTTTIRARFARKPCTLDEVQHNSDPSAPPESITIEFRKELTGAVVAAYHAEVEKLQTRAAAVTAPEKKSIPEQLAEGKKQAAKEKESLFRLCVMIQL